MPWDSSVGVCPPRVDIKLISTATKKDYAMHEVFLAGWGMPIGELFWLETLANKCRRLGRWTFFFVSEPLNVNGGVASPPNALAIL